jgi:hypothetical protein
MLRQIEMLAKEGYRTVLCDAARPEIVDGLSRRNINTIAVDFGKELSDMTMQASEAVKTGKVRLHPALSELIYQLKAVEFNEKGHPNKKRLSFDLGDAFMMAVWHLVKGGGASIVVPMPWSRSAKEYPSDWMFRG